MIITAFKIWIRLNARFFKLKTESDLFSIKYRKSDLEKIMKPDWLSSWVGTAAVANIFWHLIFEKITKKITKNSVGLFLSENQGWERALIYAYKKNVGTKIIAVPHSTVRYWDLRYSQSDLDLGLNQKDQTPNPDCYAMNGDQALSEFLNNKINNIKKVEALRYQYLLDLNKNYTEIKEQNCLLLLGDYSLERTLKMLSLITDVVISNNLKLVYKPHPFCADVRSHINPQINYAIDNRDFSQLSEKYGMAFVSNTSSVALDAYLAGLQVFVFLDDSDFNMSPLKDIAEVRFVASKEDFKDWTNQKNMHIVSRENTFFFLDKELALWSRLLKDYGLNL